MSALSDRNKEYMPIRGTANIKKYSIVYTIGTIKLICKFALANNRSIKRSHLLNIRKVLDIMDRSKYYTNQHGDERKRYLEFLDRVLEARLDLNYTNPEFIIDYVNGGITAGNTIKKFRIEEFDPDNISLEEIYWVSETISDSLKYAYINENISDLNELIANYNSIGDDGKPGEKAKAVNDLENKIKDMNNMFRKMRSHNNEQEVFSLQDDVYDDIIEQTYTRATDPSCKLFTGMTGFNKLIGGGFETQRVYMLIGLAGEGKSLTLLNLAKQIKMNNLNYKTKDPSKKPAILLLTMENSLYETIERLTELTTGRNISDFKSSQEVSQAMRNNGLCLSDESSIDLIIRYMPNKSIDTSYLYTLAEDLEDEGYELICLIQDHVKRIRSTENNKDERIELGIVVNEFKTFATLKDCVVITNCHLNRDAAKAKQNVENTKSPLDSYDTSNVGESFLMIDNTDCAIILSKESNSNRTFMGFKRIKERFKAPYDFKKMYQPFESKDSIRLVEDIHNRVPVYSTDITVDVTEKIPEPKSPHGVELKTGNTLPPSRLDVDIYGSSRSSVLDNPMDSLYEAHREQYQQMQKQEKKKVIKPNGNLTIKESIEYIKEMLNRTNNIVRQPVLMMQN